MEMELRGYSRPIRPGVTRVGWIGTGVMGAAMAGRILAAGYSLTVYARTASKAADLASAGADLVSSAADAAAGADVVFTMVGHPSDVRSVVLDPVSGVLSTLQAGGVLVDHTSSHPALAREIASSARARGCWAVDAPVSGGDVGAREGKLAIFAGGKMESYSGLLLFGRSLGRPLRWASQGAGRAARLQIRSPWPEVFWD
ncbi:hypothetical protein HPP92_023020 [Vanilla planifolia]|uniref:6-phosphogluconate dehydrogenase NADP-binding domain-containing protein n=1 Tax=Vanilla planifolia TaxID=51239 RepID=A0A835UFN4_VANPL|nr:hypothetical protein HPP92_023020 [Vanilla planifolia]